MGWYDLTLPFVAAYSAVGLAFAVAFVSVGVARVDRAAAGSGLGFRLLLVPGAALLWPLLALRWLRARRAEVPR